MNNFVCPCDLAVTPEEKMAMELLSKQKAIVDKLDKFGYDVPPGVLAILEQKDRDLKSCVLALKVYAPERLVHHTDDCACFVCNCVELWQRVERAF